MQGGSQDARCLAAPWQLTDFKSDARSLCLLCASFFRPLSGVACRPRLRFCGSPREQAQSMRIGRGFEPPISGRFAVRVFPADVARSRLSRHLCAAHMCLSHVHMAQTVSVYKPCFLLDVSSGSLRWSDKAHIVFLKPGGCPQGSPAAQDEPVRGGGRLLSEPLVGATPPTFAGEMG